MFVRLPRPNWKECRAATCCLWACNDDLETSLGRSFVRSFSLPLSLLLFAFLAVFAPSPFPHLFRFLIKSRDGSGGAHFAAYKEDDDEGEMR